MKKLLLSVLLLFVICNGCFAIESRYIVPNNRFKFSEYKGLGIRNGIRIIIDNKTGKEYLLYYNSDGVTSIDLGTNIKPAVYVHKK